MGPATRYGAKMGAATRYGAKGAATRYGVITLLFKDYFDLCFVIAGMEIVPSGHNFLRH